MSSEVYEIRPLPNDASLVAEARANPSGWVYDIDFDYRPDEEVPPEAIRGAWEVSGLGDLTGRYRINARYRPIIKRNPNLKPYVHAAARANPGKWISEIDPRGEEYFPEIPDRFINGWWLIGQDGKVTKNFRPNSVYEDEQLR